MVLVWIALYWLGDHWVAVLAFLFALDFSSKLSSICTHLWEIRQLLTSIRDGRDD